MIALRIALVTGANRGIGLEVCRQLAALGHRVILTARDLSKAEAAARKIDEAGDVVPVRLDVTDPASIRALAGATLGTTGPTGGFFSDRSRSRGSGVCRAGSERTRPYMRDTN